MVIFSYATVRIIRSSLECLLVISRILTFAFFPWMHVSLLTSDVAKKTHSGGSLINREMEILHLQD